MKTIKQLLDESKQKKKRSQQLRISEQSENLEEIPPASLSDHLDENIQMLKEKTGNSGDIIVRKFPIGGNDAVNMAIAYTDGLSDKTFVQEFIIETLMIDIRNSLLAKEIWEKEELFDLVRNHSVPVAEITEVSDQKKMFVHLLSGDTIIFIDGYSTCIVASSRGWTDRGVQEPSSQTVVRGPKDGFSETLRTNTALVRRRIKNPNLWIEMKQIGKKTQTDVAIIYLKGLVNEKIVEEIHSRLNKINIDSILESAYIEELIQDETYTPFPTILNTERPDTAAAAILEGRVVIMVDGTPFVLIVPALFAHFLQSSEDYYNRTDISIAIRLLRYLSFLLALLVPSAYIAVTTFHQEMLPTPLLVSLAAQREGVPFPAIIEALLMEITFEILREAGVRMPRAVGSAISIVGALVLGQAAVEAGIVSSAMVIVVSFTAISSFVAPSFNIAVSVRLLRFVFMILAGTLGLFGIILGLLVMLLHLNSLRSFGVPYMAPFSPFIPADQGDAIVRLPRWALTKRPKLMNKHDQVREHTPPPQPGKRETGE
jgi:spore germination protein KA